MSFSIPGVVVAFHQHYLLVHGPEAEAFAAPVFTGPVHLRPGYRLWDRADYLLPHTVVDDIGQEFDAPEAYTWLETQGDLYPRSDVLGLLPLGGELGVVTKALDLTDLAVFAAPHPDQPPFVRLALALEARAVPDAYALTPAPALVPLLDRALPHYRLSPGVFGAVGAAIVQQLLLSRKRGWQLTFDELDDMTGGL